jgi:hypothetical protein
MASIIFAMANFLKLVFNKFKAQLFYFLFLLVQGFLIESKPNFFIYIERRKHYKLKMSCFFKYNKLITTSQFTNYIKTC